MIASLALALLITPQDPPPPPPPGVDDGPTPVEAIDGLPVAPGRVPEGTSDEAVKRWRRMVDATYATSMPKVHNFRLTLDVISYRDDATNQLEAGIAYLEADHPRSPFARMHLQRKDLVSMHGPTGSWLVDGEEVTRLTGRQYQKDLEQLRDYRNLAGNLLALVQPGRLRVVELRELDVIPTTETEAWAKRRISFRGGIPLDLPDRTKADNPNRQTEVQYAQSLRGLHWVEVRSPDLRVHREGSSDNTSEIYRAKFAYEPGSGLVHLAVIMAETPDGVPLPHSALLIEVQSFAELGGYRLPRRFTVTEIDRFTHPLTFHRSQRTKMAMKVDESAVNDKELTTEDFIPPRK